MINRRTSSSMRNLTVLLLAFIAAFCLWGCDDGDGGDGAGNANFGHTLQFTISDGGAAIDYLDGNVSVNSSTGEVGAIEVNGTQVRVEIFGMTDNPTYVTLVVDLNAYVPLIRRFRATPGNLVDESGDEFAFTLLASDTMPAGGATGDSNATNYDPENGTADAMENPSVVEAAPDYQGAASVPSGTFFSNLDGSPVSGSDQLHLNFTYHVGSGDQEPYYPNGTYDGNPPSAFGTVSFRNDSGNFVVMDENTTLDMALIIEEPRKLGFGDAVFEETSYAMKGATTSACLTDLYQGTDMTMDCELGGAGAIICVDQVVVTYATPFLQFRIDPGLCEGDTPTPPEY